VRTLHCVAQFPRYCVKESTYYVDINFFSWLHVNFFMVAEQPFIALMKLFFAVGRTFAQFQWPYNCGYWHFGQLKLGKFCHMSAVAVCLLQK